MSASKQLKPFPIGRRPFQGAREGKRPGQFKQHLRGTPEQLAIHSTAPRFLEIWGGHIGVCDVCFDRLSKAIAECPERDIVADVLKSVSDLEPRRAMVG